MACHDSFISVLFTKQRKTMWGYWPNSRYPSVSLSPPQYHSALLHIPQDLSISLIPLWYPLSPPGYLSAPLSTPPYSSAPLNTSCWQFWKMFIGCDLRFIAMNLHLNCFRNINSYNFTIDKYWFTISVLLDWGVLKHGYPKNEVMMSHKRSLIAINKHCRVH